MGWWLDPLGVIFLWSSGPAMVRNSTDHPMVFHFTYFTQILEMIKYTICKSCIPSCLALFWVDDLPGDCSASRWPSYARLGHLEGFVPTLPHFLPLVLLLLLLLLLLLPSSSDGKLPTVRSCDTFKLMRPLTTRCQVVCGSLQYLQFADEDKQAPPQRRYRFVFHCLRNCLMSGPSFVWILFSDDVDVSWFQSTSWASLYNWKFFWLKSHTN